MNDILQGDSLQVLKTIPDESVDCCVTSPPYWGLRDYGVEGQLGLEKTPEEYVANMVAVFAEVKRVLKNEGTLWLNLGDSYSSGGGDTYTGFNERYDGTGIDGKQTETAKHFRKVNAIGLPPKNLVGIPWRVAFALQADGWYLRQDLIWHKPNPMPESVTDRCTKAHEYIFLLAKSQKYYFDNEAIKETATQNRWGGHKPMNPDNSKGDVNGLNRERDMMPETRNKRSVWTVTTKPYKGAHFATFPPDLITPCIKAGCPPNGIVLDPFIGSGTTAYVAKQLGRNFLGIELNPEYIRLAEKRVAQEILSFQATGLSAGGRGRN